MNNKQPISVKDLVIPSHVRNRHMVASAPWDELFKNGIPRSCSFMLTAEPGAGKTTFMLNFAECIANLNKKALFITTEQSVYDIKLTCERIGVTNIDLLETNDVQDVIDNIPNYQIVVLDSFACLETTNGSSVRQAELNRLRNILDKVHHNECIFVMIQHITKNGTYKGSTYLAHMVDVVMHMEVCDSVGRLFKVIKNRYGCCKEYEMEMTAHGLVRKSEPEAEQTDTITIVNGVVKNDVPSGLPSNCSKISDNVYKSRTGNFYLVTKHGIKYVHQDRMTRLLDKHGDVQSVIENYKVRVTA